MISFPYWALGAGVVFLLSIGAIIGLVMFALLTANDEDLSSARRRRLNNRQRRKKTADPFRLPGREMPRPPRPETPSKRETALAAVFVVLALAACVVSALGYL